MSLSKIVAAVGLLAAMLLGGCAAGGHISGYHEYKLPYLDGGYSVEKLDDEPNYFFVQYEASFWNPPELNQQYILYRSAKLALEKGFTGFAIEHEIGLTKPPVGGHKVLYGTNIRLVNSPYVFSRRVFDAKDTIDRLQPVIDQHS
jgi:hypothetical protein